MDLFETPELLPQEVKDILEKYSKLDNTYENCRDLNNELKEVGYTCDYGLDGVPYDLKEIGDEEFDFYLDQKHTIWYRNKFTITANNLEEAKAKVIALCNTGTHELPSDDWDLLHETVEQLSVGDNGGQPTEELYTHDGNMIWQNI